MGEREKRLARNEALFRDLNERLKEINESMAPEAAVFEFFCECGRSDCMDKFTIAATDYEDVRRNPRRFIVATGHVIPDIERVVASENGYSVVEKDEDDAEEIARETDPRA